MIFIFLIFCFLCLYKIKFCQYNTEYLGRDQTQKINGIFVFLILLSHFSYYIDATTIFDEMYLQVRLFLSQLVVTPFLFYSGYGIFESFKLKGKKYIKKLPIRFLKLLFRFDIAVVLFLILAICMNTPMTFSKVILSFVAWEGLGNSYWYIFVMLSMYVSLYVAFLISRYKLPISLIWFTILAILLIFIFMFSGKSGAWYNTILSFVAGVWFSYYKDYFENFTKNNFINYIVAFIVIIMLFFLTHHFRFQNLICYELAGVLFCLLVVFISQKIYIGNPILKWLGNHTFSIYILQRIPMIIGDKMGLSAYPFAYFCFNLLITLFMAYYFDYYVSILEKKIFEFKKG